MYKGTQVNRLEMARIIKIYLRERLVIKWHALSKHNVSKLPKIFPPFILPSLTEEKTQTLTKHSLSFLFRFKTLSYQFPFRVSKDVYQGDLLGRFQIVRDQNRRSWLRSLLQCHHRLERFRQIQHSRFHLLRSRHHKFAAGSRFQSSGARLQARSSWNNKSYSLHCL